MSTVIMTVDAFIVGERVTLHMAYDSAYPYEVLFSLSYNGMGHSAVFDRDIIRQALSPAGYGGCQTMVMWTAETEPLVIWMQLRTGTHSLTMVTSRRAVAQFLYDTDSAVPNGTEEIQWDVVINKILEG